MAKSRTDTTLPAGTTWPRAKESWVEGVLLPSGPRSTTTVTDVIAATDDDARPKVPAVALKPGMEMTSKEAALISTAGIKLRVAAVGNPARAGLKLRNGFLAKKPEPGDRWKDVADAEPLNESMATVRPELLASMPPIGSKTGEALKLMKIGVFSGISSFTEKVSDEPLLDTFTISEK